MEWTTSRSEFLVTGEMQGDRGPAFDGMYLIVWILIYKLYTTEPVLYEAQYTSAFTCEH